MGLKPCSQALARQPGNKARYLFGMLFDNKYSSKLFLCPLHSLFIVQARPFLLTFSISGISAVTQKGLACETNLIDEGAT